MVYDEHKTRDEDARDSMQAIAWALMFAGVGLAIVGCVLAWLLL